MEDLEIFRKLAQCEDKEQMQRVIDEYNKSQKPQTNADRIRAMSDEELAEFLADSLAKESCNRLKVAGNMLTATQIEAIRNAWYCYWMQWLKQPAEG